MKIYCLMDNEAAEGFACEHGLSLWIEARGKCLLFDAGESGAFAENAQRLGIDLGRADAAVLSHGHYDHSGGMERFFELNSRAKLYLRRGAAEQHWSLSTGKPRYIGISEALAGSGRLAELEGDCELFPGFRLFGSTGTQLLPGANSVLLGPDCSTPDAFGHEQSLILEEDGRLVLGNLLLAASSIGLGYCWIHRARETFETAEGKALLKSWGLDPDRYAGVGNCILGYPAEGGIKPAAPRKPDYVVKV